MIFVYKNSWFFSKNKYSYFNKKNIYLLFRSMDIIQQFESKLKRVWWEKVYSAREVMKLFWYDKWERFFWAIERAVAEISDEKIRGENFFFITDKSTWWRPKEDVLLTLGASYLVLKKCDHRKENVKILFEYLHNLLQEERQKSHKKIKISYEKYFLIFLGFFVVFSLWFYGKNYLHFFYSDFWYNILVDKNTKHELLEQKQKQERVFKELDEKVFPPVLGEKEMWESHQDVKSNSLSDFEIYLNTMISQGKSLQKDSNLYINFDNQFNARTEFTKTLSWENIIQSYFDFWNQKAYKDSCSLLSKKFCLSASKWDFRDYASHWEKTQSWYNVQNIKKVKENDGKNIYCVTYSYKLKNDLSNDFIVETFHFATQVHNWYEQITGRFCERIEKWWKILSCPFQLNNYYCN